VRALPAVGEPPPHVHRPRDVQLIRRYTDRLEGAERAELSNLEHFSGLGGSRTAPTSKSP
jgi:hypothetical protein